MKSSLAFLKRVISVMKSTLGSLRCNLYPGNNRDVRVVVELEVLSRRVNGFCSERERERGNRGYLATKVVGPWQRNLVLVSRFLGAKYYYS